MLTILFICLKYATVPQGGKEFSVNRLRQAHPTLQASRNINKNPHCFGFAPTYCLFIIAISTSQICND